MNSEIDKITLIYESMNQKCKECGSKMVEKYDDGKDAKVWTCPKCSKSKTGPNGPAK